MPIYKTGKSKDGKQQYRVVYCYTDNRGIYKQITKTVYGSTEAKLAEMELQRRVDENEIESTETVEQFYERYLKSLTKEVRETTLGKKRSNIKNHILPFLGKTKMCKLSADILQRWKDYINEKNLSIRMRQNLYKELNAMLNFAVKIERIKTNHLRNLGTFKDAYALAPQEEKIQYYTADEFKRFMAAAENHLSTLADYGYYTFFAIAFYTGMRKGEINALRWCDISGDVLSVTRSVNQKVKGKGYVFTPPKNESSIRKLRIPVKLINILEMQKERQKQNTDRWSEEFLVCGGITCLCDTGISNRNKQYAAEAGVRVLRIHDFRHTHATLLINQGINIKEVSKRLGHSKVDITWNTYSHLYPQEEERALSVLDNI